MDVYANSKNATERSDGLITIPVTWGKRSIKTKNFCTDERNACAHSQEYADSTKSIVISRLSELVQLIKRFKLIINKNMREKLWTLFEHCVRISNFSVGLLFIWTKKTINFNWHSGLSSLVNYVLIVFICRGKNIKQNWYCRMMKSVVLTTAQTDQELICSK